MKPKTNWKKLIVCVAIPLAAGALSALLSGGGMETFKSLEKPPLSPPGWLFPIVWSVLYILMGIASYLVLESKNPSPTGLFFYALQLIFNFFWSILFFSRQMYLFAFVWLVILWLLILLTTVSFFKSSKTAGYLMIPYLIWVAFAGYLNYGIYLLN